LKPAWANSSERPYLQKPFTKIVLVEWLKVKFLSSSPSTGKKEGREGGRERKRQREKEKERKGRKEERKKEKEKHFHSSSSLESWALADRNRTKGCRKLIE
jgi:hypothetical protein